MKERILTQPDLSDQRTIDHQTNLFGAFSVVLIEVAMLIHLLLVALDEMDVVYTKIELVLIAAGMSAYALSVLICAVKRFSLPYHKHVLLGGMLAGGGLIFAVLGEDGGAFVLFPMFVAGLYYSDKICVKTYIHLFLITIADVVAFFALDVNVLHYYGLTWNYRKMILNFILPQLLYLTVVFVLSLYAMRSGKKLIAGLISGAKENAKKKAELDTCAEVQRSTLPTDFTLAPGAFDISAGIQSALETAGDYYDVFTAGGHKLVALVADVSDKGLASALYMMSVRNTVRSLFSFTDDPDEVFTKMNNILCDTSDREFVTMFLLCADIGTGTGRYINAGHNPPVIVHPDGSAEPVEADPQLIMGMFANTEYCSEPIALQPGDILCMYTDGITDALDRNGVVYGPERVVSVIRENRSRPAAEIRDALLHDVDVFADITRFTDDRTALILKRL